MPDPISRALARASLTWDTGHGGASHWLVAQMAEEGIFLAVAIIVVGAWLASRGALRERLLETAWRLAPGVIAALLALAVAHLAGLVVPEARPFVLLGRPSLIPHSADNGFPSDHVIAGMALLAARVGIWTRLAAGAIVALVGLARVMAGIHWLDDVVAAAILGLAIAWLVSVAWESVVQRRLRTA